MLGNLADFPRMCPQDGKIRTGYFQWLRNGFGFRHESVTRKLFDFLTLRKLVADVLRENA